MTTTITITKATHKRDATPKEMVAAMYKQWQIQGNRESANKKVTGRCQRKQNEPIPTPKERWAQRK